MAIAAMTVPTQATTTAVVAATVAGLGPDLRCRVTTSHTNRLASSMTAHRQCLEATTTTIQLPINSSSSSTGALVLNLT